MAPLRLRTRLPAALVIVVIALAAACGGGDDGGGGEDRAAGLTPQELLDRSAEAAAGIESFRAELALTGQVDLSDPDALPGVGTLLNGPLEITGEGRVDPPDSASLDLRLTLSGLPVQVNVTRVGDSLYTGLLGQDYVLPVTAEQAALLDLGDLYPTLASWTVDPREGGREQVDGTETVRVTGRLDPEAALTDLAPLLGADAPTAAQARTALKEGTVEAWIGVSDLRPRRVHLVLKAEGGEIRPDLRSVEVDLDVTLSQLDEPVNIEAPRDARPLDLDQLGGFTGG